MTNRYSRTKKPQMKPWLPLVAVACLTSGCALMPSLSTKKNSGSESKAQAVSASQPVDHVTENAPTGAPQTYQRALALLRGQDYVGALQSLEGFMRDEPASPYSQAAALHSARALEGLERWSAAISRYRSVVVASEGVAPSLQAMALYRLSFCYEALGADQQTVAVLIDVTSRAKHLPPQVASAEVPARLAAAYARAGAYSEALLHYQDAEAGISRLLRATRDRKSVPEWLPQTLYFMGAMSLRSVGWQDFESSIRPLARAQTYLLQASELGVPPWSDRASVDLIATYRSLWRVIESATPEPMSDPVIAERELQFKKWDRAALVLETLTELKSRFIPETAGRTPSAQEKAVRGFSVDLEKEIRRKFLERPKGEGPTPDSRLRQSGFRPRTLNPDISLERQFMNGARESKRLEVSPASELPPKIRVIGPDRDPNL